MILVRRGAGFAVSSSRLLVLLVSLAVAACTSASEPEETSSASLSPDGVAVYVHDYVAPGSPSRRWLAADEELLLSEREDDADYTFYQPITMAVDESERLYVADSGNHRIQVFDRDGAFLRSIGREGGGPGEFRYLHAILRVGEMILAYDGRMNRFTAFDETGAYRGQSEVWTDFPTFHRVAGLRGERGFIAYEIGWGEGRRQMIIVDITGSGDRAREYARFQLHDPQVNGNDQIVYGAAPEPTVAAGANGPVYLTAADEYRIAAVSTTGDPLWELEVPWPRVAIDDDIKRDVLDSNELPRDTPLNWPERMPAIRWIGADGHGNLYVFPYAPADGREGYVVDVYSSAGDVLLHGRMRPSSWDVAQDDYIYDMRVRQGDLATEIARYRVALPQGGR